MMAGDGTWFQGEQNPKGISRRLLWCPTSCLLGSCQVVMAPSLGRKSRAKPNGKKPAAEEKKVYLEPEFATARITDCEFRELVVLPREIDLNEWLASNSAWGWRVGGRLVGWEPQRLQLLGRQCRWLLSVSLGIPRALSTKGVLPM